MRKPRGVQIRANRLIGPWEVLGGDDRRVPAKGRGRTAPYRGRSGASWIWSTPLDAGASEGELRSGYALTPSPSHSKNNLSFLQKGGPRKESSQRTATALFFLSLVWGFPIVAAGIPFVVDQRTLPTRRAIRSLPLKRRFGRCVAWTIFSNSSSVAWSSCWRLRARSSAKRGLRQTMSRSPG